ncbi:hypothetical protein [Neobacillus drentensis]|uniref:hypothetical protein n=1 Tax=Neobacillus drentensis TaxID=220684 RepID=UPI002FFDC8B4
MAIETGILIALSELLKIIFPIYYYLFLKIKKLSKEPLKTMGTITFVIFILKSILQLDCPLAE